MNPQTSAVPGLVPPRRINAPLYRVQTEEQAAEAFYSHERVFRLSGRYGIVPLGQPAPTFVWAPSETFGHPLQVPMIGGALRSPAALTTSCLRTELVMLVYAYVIATINTVLAEYAALCARIGKARKLSTVDHEAARGFCKRMYTAYLVLVDCGKTNVILHTIGNVAPACAELSPHTVNAMLALVTALHTMLLAKFKKFAWGEPDPPAERRNTFLFVSAQFGRAYSILIQHVWPAYSSGTPEQAQFQRYLLGSSLFYQAKAMMCAVQHELTLDKWHPPAVLVLARRIEYVFALLIADPALCHQEQAQVLVEYVRRWVEDTLPRVDRKFPYRDRIHTPEQYANGEHLMVCIFEQAKAESLLKDHHKKGGRLLRSDPRYCTLPRACLFQGSPMS